MKLLNRLWYYFHVWFSTSSSNWSTCHTKL